MQPSKGNYLMFFPQTVASSFFVSTYIIQLYQFPWKHLGKKSSSSSQSQPFVFSFPIFVRTKVHFNYVMFNINF